MLSIGSKLILGVAPAAIVTSIVSPIARDSASMKAAIMPDKAAGTITQDELEEVESCAIPGAGSCGGMYTANTMASAIEALGMSLPNSSAQEAVSEDKIRDCVQAGETVLRFIGKNIF